MKCSFLQIFQFLIVLSAPSATINTTFASGNQQEPSKHNEALQARVIADGIPGAGAVAALMNDAC